jgi:hypothetical protein
VDVLRQNFGVTVAFTETLELLLRADASQGISEIKKLAGETEKSVTQAESALKRFSSGALKLGSAGMGVGGFLTAMGDKDKQAAEQLRAAITATGQSYDEFEGKIESAASAQAKFGHTDEEVNDSLRVLVQSYGDTEESQEDAARRGPRGGKAHQPRGRCQPGGESARRRYPCLQRVQHPSRHQRGRK